MQIMEVYRPYRPLAKRENILNHGSLLYFWLAMGIVVISIMLYLIHDPFVPPNGGTWLGYFLGIISTLLIIWLMLLGLRRRYYRTTVSATRGWVSAHVYLGTSLLFLATLHTGFQFHWNIHTFAYVVMVIVILSGIFGVVVYLRNPKLIALNNQGKNRESVIQEIIQLNQDALDLAIKIDNEAVHSAIAQSIEHPAVGGNLRQQLFGVGKNTLDKSFQDAKRIVSAYFDEITKQQNAHRTTTLTQSNLRQKPKANQNILPIQASDEDYRVLQIRNLLDLLNQRETEEARLRQDIKLQGWMEIWLYFHIPLSFLLLGALIAHIISVFFYW